MNCEEFKELSFKRNLRVSGISVYTVEEIGLFVVVGSKDDIVDDSLEDLGMLAYNYTMGCGHTDWSFEGSSSTASVSRTCR